MYYDKHHRQAGYKDRTKCLFLVLAELVLSQSSVGYQKQDTENCTNHNRNYVEQQSKIEFVIIEAVTAVKWVVSNITNIVCRYRSKTHQKRNHQNSERQFEYMLIEHFATISKVHVNQQQQDFHEEATDLHNVLMYEEKEIIESAEYYANSLIVTVDDIKLTTTEGEQYQQLNHEDESGIITSDHLVVVGEDQHEREE